MLAARDLAQWPKRLTDKCEVISLIPGTKQTDKQKFWQRLTHG